MMRSGTREPEVQDDREGSKVTDAKPETTAECREKWEGKRVQVSHPSGAYQGEVRGCIREGFMLYSPDARKPTRMNGRYFSWDDVTLREIDGERKALEIFQEVEGDKGKSER